MVVSRMFELAAYRVQSLFNVNTKETPAGKFITNNRIAVNYATFASAIWLHKTASQKAAHALY